MKRSRLPRAYPRHRVVDVGLIDGTTIKVRPVLPNDLEQVHDLFGRLSDDSRRLRFHGSRRVSPKEAEYFVTADYRHKLGLVAERRVSDEMRVVALATYVRTSEGKAEMGIVVDDEFHGLGIGSLLVEHLSEAAQEAGIQTFEAEVLGDNYGMLDVVRHSELPLATKTSLGVVHLEFPTAPTTQALEAFEQREAQAARRPA